MTITITLHDDEGPLELLAGEQVAVSAGSLVITRLSGQRVIYSPSAWEHVQDPDGEVALLH